MDEARSLTYSINVKAIVSQAEEDIRNFVGSLGRLRDEAARDIDISADTEQASDSIRDLTSDIGSLRSDAEDADIIVDADTSQAEESIRGLTGDLGNLDSADVDISADTTEARRDVRDLAGDIGNLGENTGDIDIDADTAGASRNIRDLTRDVGRLETGAGSVGSAFRKSFLAGIDSGQSFGSSLRSGVGGAFDFAKGKAEDFKDNVVQGAEKIKNGFTHPIDTIKNGLGNAIQGVKGKFVDMARGAEEAADGADEVGDAADKAGNEVKDLGDAAESSGGKLGKFSGVAKGLVAALGAATIAVGAFAGASVNTGMEFDGSMSQVAATMGYTVEELNTAGSEAAETYSELRAFAMEMGATTSFSASQSADALNYMALAGYDAETSMAMLPNVLNLAAAGGMELATASDMVTDAQSALGLTMGETTAMVDMMAKASSKSNTSVAQLGEAILTVGGTAKNLAGGTNELSTALGILADNGVKGAEGGTALRNIILSLSSPTDKAAKALASMGVEVFDAAGNMRPLNETFEDMNAALGTMTQEQQTQALRNIFNKTDLKSVNALLANTVSGLGDIGAALESSGVDWSKYKDKAWASAEGMSEGLIEDIKHNMGELGTSAEELQEYLQFEYDLDAEDAMAVVKSMGSRWDELSGYIADAEGAAAGMAETQLDNLAGDITKFGSALEGAQIVLSDALTPTLREFTQFGTEAISTLSEAFQEGGLNGAMSALGTVLSDGLSMLVDMLPTLVDAGMQLLGALGQGILSNLPVLIGAAAQIIVTLASGIGSALPELIPSVVETIFLVAGTLLDNMPLILDAGMQILSGLSEGILSALPILVEQLPEIILQIVGFLSENLPTILEQGSQMLLSLGMGIIGALPQLVSQLPSIISSIVSFFTENLPLIVETGINLIVQLGVGLIQAIPQLVAQLPQIIAAIVGGFAELPGMMLDIGKNVVEGIWNGISQMGSWIKDKVTGFFGGIVDGVKGLLGIHSPSTVFAGIGDNMAQGVGVGFGQSIKTVSEDIQNAMPTDLDVPAPNVGAPVIPDPDLPETNALTYDVKTNAVDFGPKNGNGSLPESMDYSVNPVAGDLNLPEVSDISYGVRPVVEGINPPSVDDVLYAVNPVVGDFDPPDLTTNSEVRGFAPTSNDEGGGATGGAGTPPAFSPFIQIEVKGNMDEETAEDLKAKLHDTVMELYEEFRNQEMEHMALKEQYSF